MIWDLMPWYGPKYRPILIDLDRKATALRPDIVKNWERLALRLLGTGEYEEAIAVLSRSGIQISNRTEAPPNIGRCLPSSTAI